MNNLDLITRLSTKITKNGFTYTLVIRTEKYAIYKQQVSEFLSYYEVMKIRVKPAGFFKGREYPSREAFPCDEDFGTVAWTCSRMTQAIDILLKMMKGEV